MSLTEQSVKSWHEMSPAEWETYKTEVDARRADEGLPPIKWESFGQPQTPTEADLAWAREVGARVGLRPVKR